MQLKTAVQPLKTSTYTEQVKEKNEIRHCHHDYTDEKFEKNVYLFSIRWGLQNKELCQSWVRFAQHYQNSISFF